MRLPNHINGSLNCRILTYQYPSDRRYDPLPLPRRGLVLSRFAAEPKGS